MFMFLLLFTTVRDQDVKININCHNKVQPKKSVGYVIKSNG